MKVFIWQFVQPAESKELVKDPLDAMSELPSSWILASCCQAPSLRNRLRGPRFARVAPVGGEHRHEQWRQFRSLVSYMAGGQSKLWCLSPSVRPDFNKSERSPIWCLHLQPLAARRVISLAAGGWSREEVGVEFCWRGKTGTEDGWVAGTGGGDWRVPGWVSQERGEPELCVRVCERMFAGKYLHTRAQKEHETEREKETERYKEIELF